MKEGVKAVLKISLILLSIALLVAAVLIIRFLMDVSRIK